ncbi:restriction endonuclease subunit S [Bacillus sp. EB600]|uniref:restriction endonuclease subunit S n=1 Tax=Bacillus sp. EB600 TaxID=2806345 RepID=UPI00210E5F3A|nr:restriction endonuclease subunit S [Bacillus sp. EB600]MCQ6281071.1 restriction endonuclease subunit S [Bacillus sp. EB600]
MDTVHEDGSVGKIEIKEFDKVKKGYTYFADNDILFAKITPCMENGKGTLVRSLHNGVGYGSTEFFVIRPKEQSDELFLYYLTMSRAFRNRAERWMQGTAGQRRVPKDFFIKRPIAIPLAEEREKIGKLFDDIETNIQYSKNMYLKAGQMLSSLIAFHLG